MNSDTNKIDFTPEVIENIFGQEAAENERSDRLEKYFLKNKIYQQIKSETSLRILVAHKGVGNSATFKVSHFEDKKDGILSLWIRPDDLYSIDFPDTEDLNVMIRKWKEGIQRILMEKMANFIGESFVDNHTTSQISGNIFTIAQNFFQDRFEKIYDPTAKSAIRKFLDHNIVVAYIDDVDRGWRGTNNDIKKLSALLNALRDFTTDYAGTVTTHPTPGRRRRWQDVKGVDGELVL